MTRVSLFTKNNNNTIMSDWDELPEGPTEIPDIPETSGGEFVRSLSADGPNEFRTSEFSDNLKRKVRYRDEFQCRFCGCGLLHGVVSGKRLWRTSNGYTEKFSLEKSLQETAARYLVVHHIIPRKNGGKNKPENLITLCHDCHTTLHQDKRAHGDTIEYPDDWAEIY
jgi:hypothetical protein